jgi:predicted DNA-binding transcriptional regulator YafY
MTPAERLRQIERTIRARGTVPFAALQEALGVSRRTLGRDLAALRDRHDAPIVFDRERGGYRLAPARFGAQYELPARWFGDREVLALLTARRMLAALGPGGLVGAPVAALVEAVDAVLALGGGDAGQVRERVRVPAPPTPAPPRFFERVGSALLARQRLEIDGRPRGHREPGRREVSPQRLVCRPDGWYLDAFCHRARALRRFALDALVDVRTIDRRALEVSAAAIERALGPGDGGRRARRAPAGRAGQAPTGTGRG